MGRGKRLSEVEQQCLRVLLSSGVTQTESARQIGRSESVVRNFIRNDDQYGAKKSSGRPSKISVSDKRTIFKLATTEHMTAAKIKDAIKKYIDFP